MWRYRSDTDPPVDAIVSDLHTQEFVALRAAVIAEHQRRTGDLEPRPGDLEPRTGDLEPRTGDLQPRTGDLRLAAA